jgi:CubicO group peptidase (beta-lactamase class C family)
MLLNRGIYGGQRILSAESVRLATSRQNAGALGEWERQRGEFYGYGWVVHADGTYSHGGSDGTYVWVDPNRQIIGLVLTQNTGGRCPAASSAESSMRRANSDHWGWRIAAHRVAQVPPVYLVVVVLCFLAWVVAA